MKKLMLLMLCMLSAAPAFAAEGMSDKAVLYIAGIFGVAFAAAVGAYAQSRASSAALEGIARNPAASDKIFTPMLLALALNESLVIFTIVSIFLVK